MALIAHSPRHAVCLDWTAQGAEWVALALRQQTLLQNICAVKDRMKRTGHRLGMTSAPHAESVAAPQLARRVPSHFNNTQLRTLLRQPAPSAAGQSARANFDDSTPLYPLSKLLVLVIVRDLQRFIITGANRGIDEATAQTAKANAASPVKASAASSAPAAASSSSAVVAPVDHANDDDLSALSLEALMQRLVLRLCGIVLDDAQTAKLLREGLQLAILSLQLDKESRTILNEEAYLLAPGVDNLAPSAALSAAKAAFHDKQARSWFSSGVSPFAHFNFSRPPAALAEATRVPCPQCRRPASLYCPFCLLPTLPPELQIPPVRLPMQVDMSVTQFTRTTAVELCRSTPVRLLRFRAPHLFTSTVLLLFFVFPPLYFCLIVQHSSHGREREEVDVDPRVHPGSLRRALPRAPARPARWRIRSGEHRAALPDRRRRLPRRPARRHPRGQARPRHRVHLEQE